MAGQPYKLALRLTPRSGRDAVLGIKSIEGLDEVLRWGNVPVRPVPYPECPEVQINSPIEPILIQSVCVETFGQEFPHPVKLPMLQLPPSW